MQKAQYENFHLLEGRQQVVDGRSEAQYLRRPSPDQQYIHVINSVSMPAEELLDPRDGTLLGNRPLSRLFLKRGVDPLAGSIILCDEPYHAGACLIDLVFRISGSEGSLSKLFPETFTDLSKTPEPPYDHGGGAHKSVNEQFDAMLELQS
mmetsp:Transcript_19651/g.30321  ORF Transcript_19651/g.30321 Transcript_19651/m.30321 type:complete len:150 (+) Transcript_19651:623-1072(+)